LKGFTSKIDFMMRMHTKISLPQTALLVVAFIACGCVLAMSQAGREVIAPERYLVVKKSPLGLREFDHIAIEEVEGAGSLRIKGYAYVGETYVRLSGVVEGTRLYFVTVAHEGSTYEFEGCLLRRYDPDDPSVQVLEGRLSKYRRGRQVASARVRLTVWRGGNT
jgi:hypothetical protein